MVFGNKEKNLGNGMFYIYYKPHRNKNPKKSQWIISIDDEANCFQNGHQLCQLLSVSNKYIYWGIYTENGKVSYLGETAQEFGSDKLFIAKFIDSSKNNKWHGYPADHVYKYPEDVPDEKVLQYWLSNKLIPKAKISKIEKGKKCSL